MKTTDIIKTLILILMLLLLMVIPMQAQQEIKGMKQRIDFKFDELGDAEVTFTMKLNASQWDNFKKTIGNNQAYLKRMMVKGLPKYFLTDFHYEEEPMDRSYSFTMKAYAVAQVNEKGKWTAELDSKDPDITKLNELNYRLDVNMVSNGMFIDQVQNLQLPKKAKSAKLEKDSFGKAVLTYQLKNKSRGMNMFSILGFACMLAGAIYFVFNLKRKNPESENFNL